MTLEYHICQIWSPYAKSHLSHIKTTQSIEFVLGLSHFLRLRVQIFLARGQCQSSFLHTVLKYCRPLARQHSLRPGNIKKLSLKPCELSHCINRYWRNGKQCLLGHWWEWAARAAGEIRRGWAVPSAWWPPAGTNGRFQNKCKAGRDPLGAGWGGKSHNQSTGASLCPEYINKSELLPSFFYGSPCVSTQMAVCALGRQTF